MQWAAAMATANGFCLQSLVISKFQPVFDQFVSLYKRIKIQMKIAKKIEAPFLSEMLVLIFIK